MLAWLFQQIINQHTQFLNGAPVDPSLPPGQQPPAQLPPAQDPNAAVNAVATNSPINEGPQNPSDQQILPNDGGNQ
jgi:hypothetical protein